MAHSTPEKQRAYRQRPEVKEYDAAYRKTWRARPENKLKRVEEAKKWRAKHRELKSEMAARYNAKNPEGQRKRAQAAKARLEAEYVANAGRPRPSICDVCGEANGKMVYDHCHARGHFRGWLCSRCNKVLGFVRDDAGLLIRLAAYLERNGQGSPRQFALPTI